MSEQPKFHKNHPFTNEEILIVKMIKDLDAATANFIRTNFEGNITHEQFVILRDASIGYSGAMVRDLYKMLADINQRDPFLKEAKNIYLAYIDSIEEE